MEEVKNGGLPDSITHICTADCLTVKQPGPSFKMEKTDNLQGIVAVSIYLEIHLLYVQF